jgi:1,4-dihydroxy-2-naphthoate octaprenyltransferase
MPVAVGTVWGVVMAGGMDGTGALSAGLFLTGMLCGHSAGNILNDVCDDITGNDPANHGRISPFTGGSRVIQDGLLSRRRMVGYVMVLLAACALTGVGLIALHGWAVLAFGLVMGAMLLAYHLPPFRLNHRGLAEIMVGVMFGIAPVGMATWLQAGQVDGTTLLVSLPIALWVMGILLVNEVPDRAADHAVGKTTLAVLIGPRLALRALVGLAVAAVLVLVALTAAGILPVWGLLLPGVLTALMALAALRAHPDERSSMLRAIKGMLALHTGGSLWITASLLLG